MGASCQSTNDGHRDSWVPQFNDPDGAAQKYKRHCSRTFAPGLPYEELSRCQRAVCEQVWAGLGVDRWSIGGLGNATFSRHFLNSGPGNETFHTALDRVGPHFIMIQRTFPTCMGAFVGMEGVVVGQGHVDGRMGVVVECVTLEFSELTST